MDQVRENMRSLEQKTGKIFGGGNLGMIAGLNRMEEFELHFRAAIRNGLTKPELETILHQIAIYVGMPAGVSCFRVANRVFAELDSEPSS